MESPSALLDLARKGSIAATSRLISSLESRRAAVDDVRSDLHASGGRAHVVGITGPPGGGKSTLVSALARELRSRDRTVGILAVDPSSTLSGGAILGDRIRMQEHTLDRGIFMRSMSTRGRLGGVARATVDAVAVLDAVGWDVVIVETVGVGQAEVEIVELAHTVALVTVPGLGDDIQAIKAGLLEVADIFVVNKVDLPGADTAVADLLGMLQLDPSAGKGGWERRVLETSAVDATGVVEAVDTIEAHMRWLRDSGRLAARERVRAAARIRSVATDMLLDRVRDPDAQGLAALVTDVAERRIDPYTAARTVLREQEEAS